eukprot:4865223-Pleurochrysis_carterae.AAC.3
MPTAASAGGATGADDATGSSLIPAAGESVSALTGVLSMLFDLGRDLPLVGVFALERGLALVGVSSVSFFTVVNFQCCERACVLRPVPKSGAMRFQSCPCSATSAANRSFSSGVQRALTPGERIRAGDAEGRDFGAGDAYEPPARGGMIYV